MQVAELGEIDGWDLEADGVFWGSCVIYKFPFRIREYPNNNVRVRRTVAAAGND